MSGRNLSSPRPSSGTKTSSTSASTSRTLLNDHHIHRIAIDPSAVLGSFYDAKKECVVGKLSLGTTPISKTSQRKPVDCIIIKDDTFHSENLFQKIGIHEEPWLNSILNIVPAEGIASLVNYPFSKSTNTRFLYYYYSSEERSISQSKHVVMEHISKVIPNINATHIISTIKIGVQALIVVQLSSNDKTNIDCLLENIVQQLITNKFELPKDKKPLLDRINVIKIFSNIPDLCKIPTLADICQELTAIKLNTGRHSPLEFTLRTIQWFYPSYPNEKAKYVPLERETVKIIKQYLLSFSSQIEELKTALNPEDKQTLEEGLNQQYDTFRQQITDLQKMYSIEIEQIRDLVIKIRHGTIQQESRAEKLINTFKQSLQSKIDPILGHLQSLREKLKLIKNFYQQNIKYLNMQEHCIQPGDDLNTIFQKLSTKDKPKLIFCSTDNLRNQESSTWNNQYSKWMEEGKANPLFTLVYADFTYTSYALSEIKVLSIMSFDDLEKQSESLRLPSSSTPETVQSTTEQPQKTKKPHSPSTSPTLPHTETTSPQDKQSMNVDDQQKPSKSSALSNSQVTLKPSEQSYEMKEPLSSSISSKQPTLKNISSGTKQLNGLENVLNLSTKSLPQPSPRKKKGSTDAEKVHESLRSGEIATIENITSSNEQTNHVGEQCNTFKSQRVPAPPANPRTKRQGSNLNRVVTPTTPLKSSTAKQILSSDKQSQKIREPFSPSTPPILLNTDETSSQDKPHAHLNEQPKSATSSTRSISDISLTGNLKNEDNNKLFDSPICSKRSDIDKTSSRTEQLASVEDSANRSRSPTPQPSPRQRRRSTKTENLLDTVGSLNSSTTESTALSNEQINNEKEPNDTSHTPIILTPRAAPRTKNQSTNHEELLNHQTLLKSPIAKQISLSEKQPDCPDTHDKTSDSSSELASDANQKLKEPSEDGEEQPESASLPTSSDKQSPKIEKPVSRATSPILSDTETIFLQEKQPIEVHEQPKSPKPLTRSSSDIPLTVNQENEDNKESLNLSIPSKRANGKNAPPQMFQFSSLEDSTNPSRSPTPPARKSVARERRRHKKTENQSDTTGSSHSSTTKSKALLNEQTNGGNELNNVSNPPKMLTPRAASQTKSKSTNVEESLKSSIPKRISSSEEQSKCADEQVSLSKSPPMKSPETVQQTEKQSVDIEEQSNQLKSPELLSIEPISSSERESNRVKKENDTQISQIPSAPETTPRERRRSNTLHSSTVDYINILLLGESGVGKSTFINALVNYQAFETFEKARSNKPLVVMPVSFLMTDGDNFVEKIIRFGGIDPNEDHDHPGQSVTQYCKSYVFPISTQTKLRIIDTPGMGDTRGLEQDDRNMQHILTFINNLPHLNAICILLKPNESRLNIVLRCYFTRLLNFLGENARKNIVFCFTNTRATFFAPGNTGPLLKKMIRDLPIQNIPFDKSNTYCFDSESFRYLVALQNGIEFDSYQQKEYQQSWVASVTETNRLLKYFCQELKPYFQNEWQSIEHAHFKINQIIRPMLETMRNILRNITLIKEKSSKLIIKLCPVVPSEPSALCYKCQRTSKRFSDFWILPDDLHTFSDKCNNCKCSRKKHIDVDYKLKYELIQYEGTQSFEEMRLYLDQLRIGIVQLGQFYAYTVDNLKQNDPVLSALDRIIADEHQICLEKGPTCLNSTLHNIFIGLREEYKEGQTISTPADSPIDLSSIYEQIKRISKIDDIKEQMHAIKKTQIEYLKKNEKLVS